MDHLQHDSILLSPVMARHRHKKCGHRKTRSITNKSLSVSNDQRCSIGFVFSHEAHLSKWARIKKSGCAEDGYSIPAIMPWKMASQLRKLQLRGEIPYLIRTTSVYSPVEPFATIPESPFSAKKVFRNSSETNMPQTLDMPCSAPYCNRRLAYLTHHRGWEFSVCRDESAWKKAHFTRSSNSA